MLVKHNREVSLLAVLHPLEQHNADGLQTTPSDYTSPPNFQAKGRGNLGTPLREPEPKLLNSVQLDWESGYRSQPGEYSCELDEIDGAIPETLLGTLFRNGPGLFGWAPLLSADLQLTVFPATN